MSGDTIVQVVGVVLAAAITTGPVYITTRRTRKHVGNTNGQGSLAQMMERTLVELGTVRGMLEAHTRDEAIHRRGLEARVWYGEEGAAEDS